MPGALVDLLDPTLFALLEHDSIERNSREPPRRIKQTGDQGRQQCGLARIVMLDGFRACVLALGDTIDLVLGIDEPGALVDDVRPALEQAPDGAPARDIVGANHRRLPQHYSQRQGDSRGDDDQCHEVPGLGSAWVEFGFRIQHQGAHGRLCFGKTRAIHQDRSPSFEARPCSVNVFVGCQLPRMNPAAPGWSRQCCRYLRTGYCRQ